jgi:putative oxidoreductase
MKLSSAVVSFEGLLARIGSWLQPVLLLAIRLYWGCALVRTGWGKLHNLDGVAGYFASLQIPLPKLNAMLAASTETFGGALLVLGLFSRFVTPVLITLLMVAYFTAERDALFSIFRDPDKFTGADPFLFLYAALIVFCFGPGKLSLDALLRKKGESGK